MCHRLGNEAGLEPLKVVDLGTPQAAPSGALLEIHTNTNTNTASRAVCWHAIPAGVSAAGVPAAVQAPQGPGAHHCQQVQERGLQCQQGRP